MNRTPSDKSSSSETKEETLPSSKEEKIPTKTDLTIIEGELFTNLKNEHIVKTNVAKTLDCEVSMNEIPFKGGDTVIDMLTEKNVDSIIEHRQRSFLVYFGIETKTEPVGAILNYGEGDRNDFVRLVFLITTSMLTVTTAFVSMVLRMKSVNDFMRTKEASFVVYICLACQVTVSFLFAMFNCARRVPVNWLLLVVTTIIYSYIVGFFSAAYEPYIVLCAAGTTLLISAICLGLAFTKVDFTKFLLIVLMIMIALMAAVVGLIVLSVMGIQLSLLRKVILVISTIVSAAMLVIEFQMILGGKTVEIGEDDYCYAAYLIYISIIDIFLKLLRIYSEFQNSESEESV